MHLVWDRAYRRGGRSLGVATVEGEVGLVQLANGEAGGVELLAALLHVALGVCHLAVGEQAVDLAPGIAHEAVEVEPALRRLRGWRRRGGQAQAAHDARGQLA